MDLSGLEGILLSIHLTLSVRLQTPELELDPSEAKRLAEAAANVARHYPIMASEEMRDWSLLLLALGSVYAPRGTAIWLRKRGQARQAVPRQGAAMPQPRATGAGGNGAGTGPSPSSSAGFVAVTPSQLDPLAMMGSADTLGSA